jgi:hypothetical protein
MDNGGTGGGDKAVDAARGYKPARLLAELKAEAHKGSPAERPNKLPVTTLKRVPELFQPRRAKEDRGHVGDLVRAIQNVGALDPILVMDRVPAGGVRAAVMA